jgi:formylglycine-generating enzyme required for sulfatase activity
MTPRVVAGFRTPKTAWVPALDAGRLAFRLGRTPVTNAEYAPYLAEGGVAEPPWWRDAAFAAADQPVVGVTWSEAEGFAAWLGRAVGGLWRLPTAAEWEWAARGGLAGAATPWGEGIPEGEIPVGPLLGPWPAGGGTPNGYGLLDMGTIIHEWCSDLLLDPRAPEGERRVSCGGSWRHQVRWSPPAARSSLPPTYRYADYGFRVLREGRP